MNPTVVAALVGFVSAVVASVVAAYLGFRRLRTELHAQVRKDYMQRQIAACEDLWQHLLPLSEYPTPQSIVKVLHKPYSASPARAQAFCEDITATFFSPTGLYVSRDVRFNLFVLRTLITRELLSAQVQSSEFVPVSNAFVKRYRHHTSKLFRAVRAEVGAIDLRAVREGPID